MLDEGGNRASSSRAGRRVRAGCGSWRLGSARSCPAFEDGGARADMGHAPAAEPVGQITRDVCLSIVGEQPRPMRHLHMIEPGAAPARARAWR